MDASLKTKVLALEEIDSSKYESVDLDRLVMYAVAKLVQMNIDLSLENIIVATFKLFPSKFSILGYPEYPDATRVEKCLWRCKGKRRDWLGGKTPHGYAVTERGWRIVDQAASLLSTSGGRTKSQTRRKESIIVEVTCSPAYLKYLGRKTN